MEEQLDFSGFSNYLMRGLVSLIPDEIVLNVRPVKNMLIGGEFENSGRYISFRYDSKIGRSYPEHMLKDVEIKEVVYVVPEKFREQYSLENGINYNK